MSDTATERQPTKPFFGTPIEGELLEIPPSIGYVVHLLHALPQGSGTVWAWCRVTEGGPGYDEVVLTLDDGVTRHAVDGPLRLGPVLFKVFC
jgi:hypothetical protein